MPAAGSSVILRILAAISGSVARFRTFAMASLTAALLSYVGDGGTGGTPAYRRLLSSALSCPPTPPPPSGVLRSRSERQPDERGGDAIPQRVRVWPPSASTIAPWQKSAEGEARNATRRAISTGWPNRATP